MKDGTSSPKLSYRRCLCIHDNRHTLPYEVLDTIVELSDIDDYKDFNRVNVFDDRGPTRPIYRLDLDPEYIAYYEIDT